MARRSLTILLWVDLDLVLIWHGSDIMDLETSLPSLFCAFYLLCFFNDPDDPWPV